MRELRIRIGTLIFSFGFLIHVQAQLLFTNGLVSYYPLNGNANDQFGSGNIGILENGAYYPTGSLGSQIQLSTATE